MLFRGFSELVQQFWERYPRIELRLREMNSSDQLQLLRAGELDAAFVNNCAAPAGFAAIAVSTERFMACVHAGHPLARRRSIPVRALAKEPFVLFKRGASSPYHDYIMTLCSQAGFQPRVRVEAMQLTSVAAFVAGGAGVAILPESIAAMQLDGARFVRLDAVQPVTSAFLVWDQNSAPPTIEALIRCVQEDGQPGSLGR
jgi:DNA-binding transcriptional LysR family regulator